ncbi:MAG: hypothetical protein JRH11_26420 [Deltaproteobacteria bacterium]|nr:hypothetical protein [Deltaproteobacteria bacterium]
MLPRSCSSWCLVWLSVLLVPAVSGCALDTSAVIGSDSGAADSGSADSGAADSGSADSGSADSGAADSGAADSGGMDSGAGDTGVIDAGCDPTACPGHRCQAGACAHYESCEALHGADRTLPSGVYPVLPVGRPAPFDVYCEMSDAGGGWTLVLKTDGTTSRFDFTDALWTDGALHNETSLDLTPGDAKLRAYLEVPFDQVRVGLQPLGGTTRWLMLQRADGAIGSMREAMMQGGAPALVYADGTAPTYDDWVAILPGADAELQRGCGRSALPNPGGGGCGTICANVRVGILGNNSGSCMTPDSYLGLGGHPSDNVGAAPTGAVSASSVERQAYGYLMVR